MSGVLERLKERWAEADYVQKKWKAMKDAMCEVNWSVLGKARRREANWFREGEDVLRPVFEWRSRVYTQWLSS